MTLYPIEVGFFFSSFLFVSFFFFFLGGGVWGGVACCLKYTYKNLFLFVIIAADAVPCGGRKKFPCPLSIMQLIFYL